MNNAVAASGGGGLAGIFKSSMMSKLIWSLGGFAILAFAWWLFGNYIASNPNTASFANFGLIPTLQAFPELLEIGKLQSATTVSLNRLFVGLGIAIIIGIPVGILIGQFRRFNQLSNSPFQLLRMVSPLAWSPIAVFVFSTWYGAIVFLIAMASVWPIMFSTAAGLAKVDPAWFKVARNLGAGPVHMVTRIILPAITFDILSGLRLALGVAWIVLVPAEYLGVTSGLGYAIQDARETLSYDHLTAIVLSIGAIGYVLDTTLAMLIKKFSWHRGGVC
ncbi:ABC transporter permease [Thiohalophilus sp.]|uniref:ABC transporter permease n=1 Tax=Thiohalophilus sp. TaxID=3028392 RepID=UPI002ACDA5C0|nr:ABC transporter permease subunit [Thiohalophilus sp.]MDZ7803960.1 ABC transporter permease subunit [Thiohalophilus sp.]